MSNIYICCWSLFEIKQFIQNDMLLRPNNLKNAFFGVIISYLSIPSSYHYLKVKGTPQYKGPNFSSIIQRRISLRSCVARVIDKLGPCFFCFSIINFKKLNTMKK